MKTKRPDYKNSIANVSNSFLRYYNAPQHLPSHPTLDQHLKNKQYNHIIYVLLDGMGSNIIKKHCSKTDALYQYMVQEITSVFPPTTVAATNAVLSGKQPIETGYIGWVQYFKQEDSNLIVFLNKDFYTGKTFDYNLRKKYLHFDDILTQIKSVNPSIQTNIFFPALIEEGTAESFHHEVEQVLLATHNTDQSFNYVYWTQPDLTEHQFGIDSDETKSMVQQLNQDFESLLENIADDTLVVCIADHGLTDVEEINIHSYPKLMSMLEREPSIEPRAINFYIKPEHKSTFKEEFNLHFKDIYLLVSKEDFYVSELLGNHTPHPLTDQFIGDYIGIAIDKYMFSLSDVKSYKAHHAGLSEDEMMVPLIIYDNKKEE